MLTFFFTCPMAFSMVAGWGAKGRAGIALNPIAEIWGVGPCGEEGGSRVGAQFHSVRVAFASEAATVIFPVFRRDRKSVV